MSMTDKRFIGIIAAEVNSIEQRQIMKGVIAEGQELKQRIVVFSNIYNSYEYDQSLDLENNIYELMFSQELCGLIMIAESFTNEMLRDKVRGMLEKRQDIPVVIIGIYIPELAFPNVRFINANDSQDMESITTHLIEKHGFRKIDMLTGFEGNEAAIQRVTGYRKSLEMHGITFEASRVFWGDFWMPSGVALANRYISGELEMPDAIICANDYMAYGLLDTFLENGVRIPDDVSVIGYEFIQERIFHSPILTTYQRGRKELGRSAVRILHALANGDEPPAFYPPKGTLICGETCPCGIMHEQMHAELQRLREKRQFERWNVLGTMEQQLTLCSTLDELVRVMSERYYWVRSASNMYLCLCDNWYDTGAETPSDLMNCRSVMPWHMHEPPIVCPRYDFNALYQNAPDHAVHYYLPIFFERHFFGYYVLEYHQADTYDDIFRNWMKSITIGLTFLCMKNDIRYLLQCQNLSEQHDSLTGLYNLRGMESVLGARLEGSSTPVYAIAVRIGALRNDVSPEAQVAQSALIQKTAEALRLLNFENVLIARSSVQTFICAGLACESEEQCALLEDKLTAVLLHHTGVCESVGMESVLVESIALSPSHSASENINMLHAKLESAMAHLADQKIQPHADTLFSVRNHIYNMEISSADSICRKYSFSTGYFRQIYKEMFGISFHQDVIRARILCAIYLLTTTVQSIASISEQCGYEDCNYFLRQFQKITGLTPGQYRRLL
ncbi:MAG: substrate-binding domain-containing protein [Oscillospiraceae bacterium]|nr:substrate-binding domain-containing protein [Oscillospiraceae bacterium]